MPIRLSNIHKRFGAQSVLTGVDFEIADGQLVALLGASGSGKTTLLRILAGLEWPDGGEVLVDGQSWLARPTQERGVGFVPQNYALFDHLTVVENIAFGLRVQNRKRRLTEEQILTKVDELLELMLLHGLGRRYPAQLSGGQRQRVAFARALAIQPTLLLLDEPFSALDAGVRQELRRWLRTLQQQLGMTTVFVTYDQEEAFELADVIVLLNEGRIEQVGSPDQIYENPKTPFVLRFLGAANEINGRLAAGRFETAGVDATAADRIAAGDGVAVMYVRPQDVDVQPAENGAAIVKSIVMRGPYARVDVELPDRSGVEAEIRRDVVHGRKLNVGQRATVRIANGRVFASARRGPDAAIADAVTHQKSLGR